jgi:stress response protein YsnF
MSYTSDNQLRTTFPMLDMMFQMQQMGLRAMTMYQPVVSAMLTAGVPLRSRTTEMREIHDVNEEHVIPVGEEVLNVGTRLVPGKTTRVRRVVVQTPVHQDVTLHTETVVLERRKPVMTSGGEVLTELTVEMSDFNEVPVVSKEVHLVEEVLLRKEVTARTETIHDTVKQDKLEIDQPSQQLPVVFNAAQKQEEKRREERRAAEVQDKKQAIVPAPTDSKPADPKRP